jgi:uncharacterized protein YdhG (YjbR/CyaY superfamily)
MQGGPANIDEYLASVSDEQREALEDLLRAIKDAVPDAAESIGYGIVTLKQDGRPLVGLGATPNHCAFYLMSSSVLGPFRAELADYSTSAGTIRFQPDRPLPPDLVRRLVLARLEENDSQSG